jgi:hypothetical protein
VAKGFGFQKGEQGYEPTVLGLLSTPALLANPIPTLVAKKGVAKLGGWMVDKARDIFADQGLSGKQAQEFSLDTTPVTNPQTGLPMGFTGTGTPSSGLALGGHDLAADLGAPPVSSLADVDFGGGAGSGSGAGGLGGFGTGFGFGGFGAGAVGGFGGGGEGTW